MIREKINLKKWASETKMSTGLRNSLLLYNSLYRDHTLTDITKESFLKIEGVGLKRWEELERLMK